MSEVFVFPASKSGIHSKGPAAVAYQQHGAQWGASEGRMGDSYAIPMGSVESTAEAFDRFLEYAAQNLDTRFVVVGLDPEQFFPVEWANRTENVVLPGEQPAVAEPDEEVQP